MDTAINPICLVKGYCCSGRIYCIRLVLSFFVKITIPLCFPKFILAIFLEFGHLYLLFYSVLAFPLNYEKAYKLTQSKEACSNSKLLSCLREN